MIARMIAKRIALGLVTLVLISLIIFFSVQLLPGDAARAILGRSAPPEAVATLRAELGLDLPAHARYLHWAGSFLQGDFGNSLANRRPVLDLLSDRIGNTFFLAAVAACIAVPLGLVLGLATAIFRGRAFDHAASLGALVMISVPEFLTAYILVTIFAVKLGWLPAVSIVQPGQGLLDRLVLISLPAATLALAVIAYILRMTRALQMCCRSWPIRACGAAEEAIDMRMTVRAGHAPFSARIGLAIIVFYVAAALLGPFIAPYGQTEVAGDPWAPMFWRQTTLDGGEALFILGTDHLGRDLLTRLLYGARNSVGIALVTTLLAFATGAGLGLLAATKRGVVDQRPAVRSTC